MGNTQKILALLALGATLFVLSNFPWGTSSHETAVEKAIGSREDEFERLTIGGYLKMSAEDADLFMKYWTIGLELSESQAKSFRVCFEEKSRSENPELLANMFASGCLEKP